MPFPAGPWIVAVILGFLALSPATAHAGMTPEEVKAFEGYKAAAQGDAKAQTYLGYCYRDGRGVAKDKVQQAFWYHKAAEQGYAEAQANLGVCYRDGVGVAKDDVQAVSWYRKAAEQGYAEAQYMLGACYYSGRGVAKDEVETFAYYSLAGITIGLARTSRAFLAEGMSPDARIRGQQRAIELGKEIEAKIAAKKAGK